MLETEKVRQCLQILCEKTDGTMMRFLTYSVDPDLDSYLYHPLGTQFGEREIDSLSFDDEKKASTQCCLNEDLALFPKSP